jgi:hypothetical protein
MPDGPQQKDHRSNYPQQSNMARQWLCHGIPIKLDFHKKLGDDDGSNDPGLCPKFAAPAETEDNDNPQE